jgi:uncharacterized protein
MSVIDKRLLDILVCPACKEAVGLVGQRLVCQRGECALSFPIREGIPVMLIDQAENPRGEEQSQYGETKA